eukprot:TRINITY_DN27328_c0_g1_i1.p2 TRINITY_DN27328_c0_g1~~TRINITY_DN27328_c0_g1_i1.p2  ORF type:complete len:314 (+),score=97.23 TRINITY_DN27328_c0_g1_i1:83-1024(+)
MPPPTRDDLLAFLLRGLEMMVREDIKEEIADKVRTPEPGKRLIALQRAEWEPLGFNADEGCAALDRVDADYPGDEELLKVRDRYIVQAMRSYLGALEARRPAVLEKARPMPKDVIIEFFNACNTRMDLPEFREQLTAHIQKAGTPPSQLIVEAQRELLEVMGWEADHGCACLTRAGTQDYKDDALVMRHFAMWQSKAQRTCMEVMNAHRAKGGQVAMGMPELQGLHAQAKEEIAAMSAEERKALLQKMEPRLRILHGLKPEDREAYIRKLGEPDRLEMAKVQVLTIMFALQRQQQVQEATQEAKKPAQQQMMT